MAVGAPSDDALTGSAYIFVRSGTTWSEQAKLTASDGATDDVFGASVAISGDSVIAGAFGDDDGGSRSGSAYVFTRSATTWSQQAKLIAGDAATLDDFGNSVGISGNTAVIGAFGDDDVGATSGSAYIFVRSGTTWSQQAKLIASDADAFDRFGFSVAISGDTVVAGADRDDDVGTASGSAYIFVRSGTAWSQQAKLIAGDAAASDGFGISVAISGDTVVAGAQNDDDGGSNSGSAYVFARTATSWAQQGKLAASDAATGDGFGNSVAISGDTVVVGAYLDDDNGVFDSGGGYVFVRSGTVWTEQAKLTASDAGSADYFGFSVAIYLDSVVIGAYRDDDGGAQSGSAYVFARSGTTWSQQDKLTASDAAANDQFGWSVAVSGDGAVIGAWLDDDGGINSGSAYIFLRDGTTWTEQGKLIASDAADLDGFGGSVAISGDTVLVGAEEDDDGAPDSGSVYIYRFSVAATNKLLVFDHLGFELTNGGDATSFPGQLLDTGKDFLLQLTNGGQLDLDIQSVSLGGADAGQFGLVLPDISSPADLASNESLEFTISFNPSGATSGPRNAIVLITSDDPVTVFSFNVTGVGLSESGDLDDDGMSDWGEYSLRGFGFDWETSQSNLVSDFYAQAHTAGLYTEGQIAGIVGDGSFFDVDPTNHTVDLVIELQQTLDLLNYTQLTLDPAKLSIDGDGNLRYELDTSAAKKFFRAVWKD